MQREVHHPVISLVFFAVVGIDKLHLERWAKASLHAITRGTSETCAVLAKENKFAFRRRQLGLKNTQSGCSSTSPFPPHSLRSAHQATSAEGRSSREWQ